MGADVVVIGGGLGGLSVGIALARSGREVVIVEARRAPARDAWGYILWPPATRSLEWLGVLDDTLVGGAKLHAFRWYAEHAHEWLSVDLDRIPGTFVGILPSGLEQILRRAALREQVQLLEVLKDWRLHREGTGWTVHCERDAGELTITAPLVVGADGPGSRVRQVLGLPSSQWQPPGQVILTGVGGPLSFHESRQAIGTEWSGGCADIGLERSWLYAMTNERRLGSAMECVRSYAALDPETHPAFGQLDTVAEVRPWSITVPRWAVDGCTLMGDAAHAMLPHLGLGGTLTLEDVPVLCEVLESALRTGDTSAGKLAAFQRRRSPRVSYARRISNLWALCMTSESRLIRFGRDLNFRRLGTRQPLMNRFVSELASPEIPSISTRLAVWLP